jgi:hypothetical protein
LFGSEVEVPLEMAARLILTLELRSGDRLTGRFLSVRDDIENLIGRVDEIRQEDLISVRLRRQVSGHYHAR